MRFPRLLLAAAIAASLSGSLVAVSSQPTEDTGAVHHNEVVVRSGDHWRLVRYGNDQFSDCTDLEVFGGAFGGCGYSQTFHAASIGEANGTHGAFGTWVPAGTATVRATLSDGKSVTDGPVRGSWVIVWTSQARLVKVEALSAGGRVLASA